MKRWDRWHGLAAPCRCAALSMIPLVGLALAGLALAPAGAWGKSYSFTQIDNEDYFFSYPISINNNGQILFRQLDSLDNHIPWNDIRKAQGFFVWSNGTSTELALPTSTTVSPGIATHLYRMNDLGQIAGASFLRDNTNTYGYAGRATIWNPDGSVIDVAPKREPGWPDSYYGYNSFTHDINNRGEAVGSAKLPDTQDRYEPFYYSPSTGFKRFPNSLNGVWAFASNINNTGQVLGTLSVVDPATGASGDRNFIWSPGSDPRIVPAPTGDVHKELCSASPSPCSINPTSFGQQFSSSGQIIGTATVQYLVDTENGPDHEAGSPRNYIWDPNTGYTLLPKLSAAQLPGLAGVNASTLAALAVIVTGASDSGQFVGVPETDCPASASDCSWSPPRLPVLWDKGRYHDVTSFLPSWTQDINHGWTVSGYSLYMNGLGQIVGAAQDVDAYWHTFLLTPVPDIPEPGTAALLGAGLLGLGFGVALRRRRAGH